MLRTLDELLSFGLIRQVRVPLLPGEMPERRLFITSEFGTWLDTLSRTQKSPNALLTERTEIATVFADFIAGRPRAGLIHDINPPKGQGIIRLRSTTFRLYGWCAATQTLLLAIGARKQDIKDKTAPTDADNGRQVAAIRKGLACGEGLSGGWFELFRLRSR